MEKVIEIICEIPESIGWIIVGAAGMLCMVMMVKLAKIGIECFRYWREDNKEVKEDIK